MDENAEPLVLLRIARGTVELARRHAEQECRELSSDGRRGRAVERSPRVGAGIGEMRGGIEREPVQVLPIDAKFGAEANVVRADQAV